MVVALVGVQLIGVAAAGRLVLFLAGAVGVRLRAHEHRYIFITLGHPGPRDRVAVLPGRAIATAGVSV